MTEIQKKEFKMLEKFVDICNELGLRYWLVCGSALGAVKYKGFVPWDDDIDVALPRNDYEIFLEKAPEMLPEGIFLQNYRTVPDYPGMGSKLVDLNTTYIEKSNLKLNIKHGVFVDVFPLDGYPSDKREQKIFEKKKWYYYRRRYTALVPFWHRDLGLTILSALRLIGIYSETCEACRKAEELVKNYPLEDSRLWCNFANSMKKSEYAPREQYGEGADAEFEGLKVKIPERFDEYLTQKYGNWRADLPENKKVLPHAYIFDTEKSYEDYKKGL